MIAGIRAASGSGPLVFSSREKISRVFLRNAAAVWRCASVRLAAPRAGRNLISRRTLIWLNSAWPRASASAVPASGIHLCTGAVPGMCGSGAQPRRDQLSSQASLSELARELRKSGRRRIQECPLLHHARSGAAARARKPGRPAGNHAASVPFPAEINFGGFATQCRRPIGPARIDGAARIVPAMQEMPLEPAGCIRESAAYPAAGVG